MKHLKTLGAVTLAAALAACGGGDNGGTTPPSGFQQPAGTVAVNFVVDDTTNKLWKSEELEWKGGMLFDATTRIATPDSTWGGPWAKLFDDGPWTAGGHEPAGAVANDHKLGVTIFVKPPATGSTTIEYGLRDATNPDKVNGGWVWVGSNGSFVVPAGATAAINADGLTFPAHGTTDLKITLTKAQLPTDATWAPWLANGLFIKGSAWGWKTVELKDDGTKGDATAGDGIYTLVVSQALDMTKPPYPGLLKTGDKPEWVFVFHTDAAGTEKEYKGADGLCHTEAVGAESKAAGAAAFTPVTPIGVTPKSGDIGGGNTYVTIP